MESIQKNKEELLVKKIEDQNKALKKLMESMEKKTIEIIHKNSKSNKK